MSRAWRVMIGVAALAALGCAQAHRDPLTPPATPVVWPKPPDEPRIRLLGELKGSDDVQTPRTAGQFWNEVLFGPAKPWRLTNPHAVAVSDDGQRVAIADTNGACVHIFGLGAKSYVRYGGCPPKGPAFECPSAVAWAGTALYVADSMTARIVRIDSDTAGKVIVADRLKRPAGLAFCRSNDLLYATDAAEDAVVALDRDGSEVVRFGTPGGEAGQFNHPTQIACGPNETIAVVDSLNFRVQCFGLDGTFRGEFGRKGDAAGDLALPKGAAFDADGQLWVVDGQFENVQGFTADGKLLLAFGGEGRGPGQFWLPAGVTIDAQRRMWVADSYNRRVQVFEFIR